jgi:hypothetical protein
VVLAAVAAHQQVVVRADLEAHLLAMAAVRAVLVEALTQRLDSGILAVAVELRDMLVVAVPVQ